MSRHLDASVGVIIAAYNAESTVARSVCTALRQAEVREVVVVDDASTDATVATALAADDSTGRLRVASMSINRGPAAARNHALEGIVSEYVCVLDADDWLQDGRFGRMFSRVPMHWDLLADDLLLASEAAPSLPRSQLLGIGEGEQREVNVVDFVAANISDSRRPRRELGYLKPLMRRGFLESMRLRYDDRVRLGEDFVLYVQALLRGAKLVLVPSCGYVAVARSGSLSRAHGALELAALEAADGRLLEEARIYCPNAVPILTAHRRSIRHKLEHRRMLDAKQSGDWPAAARAFLKTPSGAAHILTQTLRSKLSGL